MQKPLSYRRDGQTDRRTDVISALYSRLLNPVLLNKSGLVRAKAGNFNLKSLNRCFSNYYQLRTWRVFAESVTYYDDITIYKILLEGVSVTCI